MHLDPLMDTMTNLLVGLLVIQLAEDMITFSVQIKFIIKSSVITYLQAARAINFGFR